MTFSIARARAVPRCCMYHFSVLHCRDVLTVLSHAAVQLLCPRVLYNCAFTYYAARCAFRYWPIYCAVLPFCPRVLYNCAFTIGALQCDCRYCAVRFCCPAVLYYGAEQVCLYNNRVFTYDAVQCAVRYYAVRLCLFSLFCVM